MNTLVKELVVCCAVLCSAWTSVGQQAVQPAPPTLQAVPVERTGPTPSSTRFDLTGIGYAGLSKLDRFRIRFNLSLDFIDSDHLLFTYSAHNRMALLTRRPECPSTHSDHLIHAAVIDLRNGHLTAETDWYLHDYGRYLWPLGDGRFLKRSLNSFYLIDSELQERLLYTSPRDVLWSGLTADRKQLIVESSIDKASSSDTQAQKRIPIRAEFLDLETFTIRQTAIVQSVSELETLSTGYADALHNPVGKSWLVRFGAGEQGRKNLMQVRSDCRPDLLFPTDDTLLVGRCSADRTDYSVSMFTLGGHPLWRQRWTQRQYYPDLLRNGDGSRIVVSTVTANSDDVEPVDDNNEIYPDVQQDIRVLEAATGKEVLRTQTKTVILKNVNYALSEDGLRFALIDGHMLAIYDLPSMTSEERAKYVAMKADSPDLSAVLPDTTEGESQQASAESQNPEPKAALSLAAPVRGQSGAAPAQGAAGEALDARASNPETSPSPDSLQAAEGPALRIESEEVTVDAVVTDSREHAVTNLSKDDFHVLENGKPQHLNSFREYGSQPSAAAKPETNTSRKSNVFNNNDSTPNDQPVGIILLDYLNTETADQQFAIQQLVKFLRQKPEGMKFAIFTLTTQLVMQQGLTSDENLLLATLNSKRVRARAQSTFAKFDLGSEIQGYKDAAASDANLQPIVQQLVQEQANFSAIQFDRRVAITADAFTALARYLASTPERKSLIWISGSFPLSFMGTSEINVDAPEISRIERNYSTQLRKFTNLMADAHIAVYPVNAHGLTTDMVPMNENPNASMTAMPGSAIPAIAQGMGGSGAGTNTASSIQAPSALELRTRELQQSRISEQQSMLQVASDTGGKAFLNTNGLTEAFKTALELGTHYYLLSYSPENRKHDGSFRKLKVLLDKKGYRLAYRSGYFAANPQAEAAKYEVDTAMSSAAMERGAPQARQLVFATQVVPVGKPHRVEIPAPSGEKQSKGAKPKSVDLQHYSVDYAIASSELKFGLKGADRTADLILLVAAFGDDHAALDRHAFEIKSTLTPKAYKDTAVGGLRSHLEFDVSANAASLRLGVIDALSGHLGTLELPLPLPVPPEESRLAKRKLPPIEPN